MSLLYCEQFLPFLSGLMVFLLRDFLDTLNIFCPFITDKISQYPVQSVYRDPEYQTAFVGETWRVRCIFSGL